jgi:hypothetical protein
MLRGLVIERIIGIGIMSWTPMATGNHNLTARFCLHLIKEVDQNGINKFFLSSTGQAMLLKSSTIEEVNRPRGIFVISMRRVNAAAPTPKKFFGDLGMGPTIGLLPRIELSFFLWGCYKGVIRLVVATMDELSFSIHSP